MLLAIDCPKNENTSIICDHRRDADRVEVCRFGCWGTVHDEGWDRNSSIVACRELGVETEQAIPTRGGYFSNVNSSRPIHVSRIDCGKDANNKWWGAVDLNTQSGCRGHLLWLEYTSDYHVLNTDTLCDHLMQVQAHAKMVKLSWLIIQSSKEEWRCATMEYGGQCVLVAGIMLLLILSVINLDTQTIMSFKMCY